ncbi:MAG: alpha/beta fold hydrolase, partial [Bdellovibrionales bacterium]|nr:alpha/beta fold hydrolase [Bdellovibrionales bacterium]
MRQRSKAWLLAFLCATGCAGAKSQIIPPRSEIAPSESAVIFVPGYYGSALKEAATGERRFVTFRQMFGDDFTLALHQERMKTPPSKPLVVEGVIGTVSAVPWIKEFEGYSETLEFLGGSFDVYPFAYDWRQDLIETASALGALVNRLDQAGVKNVSLVAHSMGGLVAAWYLRYGTQSNFPVRETWEGARKVKRVVFAGVPFRGIMSILRNMQTGAPMYWNEKLLQQEAVSSFPSSYYLLPWPTGEFIDQATRPAQLNARNEVEWIRNDWGLLKEEDFLDTRYRRARESFTRDMLEKSTRFLVALHAPVASLPKDLRLVNVVGFGTATLARGYWVKEGKQLLLRPWDVKNYDKTLEMDELHRDGDETVTVESAELPE